MNYEDDAAWLVAKCLKHDYHLWFEDAITVMAWWLLRDGTLLPQGRPGSGKTSLVNTLAQVLDVPETASMK